MVTIEEVQTVEDELVRAFERLVPQLSSAPVPTRRELEAIVASGSTVLLVARDGREIVGTLCLVVFRIPTGVRTRIEDVIVDQAARGKGVGEQLTRAALARAAQAGATTVDLTSRPSREAANRLYQRLGFQRPETNMYRYKIETR